jgi:hypothetical protein
MRVLGLAFAVLFIGTVSIATHANGPRSNMGTPGIVLAWDGDGSGGHSAALGGHPTAGYIRQWNGQWVPPHWGPGRYYGAWGPYGGPRVPTYWVWGPSGGAFDYPFADEVAPGWGAP